MTPKLWQNQKLEFKIAIKEYFMLQKTNIKFISDSKYNNTYNPNNNIVACI